MANYNFGKEGLRVNGVPIVAGVVGDDIYVGNTFYVHNGTGSDTGKGTVDKPFKTLDYAVGRCTATSSTYGKQDVIFLMPGHAENLAAADAVDIDVAGVQVIGLGRGSARPTFTYTAAAGEIVVGASNVRISNIIMNASVTTVLLAIDIETTNTDTVIDHCLFGVDLAGTDEFNNAIVIGDQSNRTIIANNECHMGTAAAVSFVKSDADNDYSQIVGNFVSGDYSTACIVGDEQDDMILVSGNRLYNGQATGVGLNTEPVIELHANTTGVVEYNQCYCNVANENAAIVADDCHLHENYYNETESSTTTTTVIGTAWTT